MAEGEQSFGGWIGSWLQTAKEKSTNAFDFVKRDLAEFSSVIQSDTTKAVSMTRSTISENLKAENAAVAKSKVQQGFSNILQGISKALEVIDVEENANDPIDPNQTKTAVYDRAQARLRAVQVDPGTYCNAPSSSDKFIDWLKTFDMENQKGDISELLVSNTEIRALYTNLVPTMVSHTEFWQRYFFKIHQLQQDEARKLALMKRADDTCKDDAFSWDDDEDWSADEELEIVDEKTLAELVDQLDELEESTPSKPDVNENTFIRAPKVPEETHFRKAVTVEQEIGSTALVEEQVDACLLNEQNVAELQVDTDDSVPQSQSNSESALDQLTDIQATSNFVNSDSLQNEDVTVFEQPLAEVDSRLEEPCQNDNIEAKLSCDAELPCPSEEKLEEPDLATSVSESISLNEEELTNETDHVYDDNMADSETTNCEWKNLSESPLSSSISDISKPRELKTTCKGDMVVVGSLAGSPASDASDILKDVAGSSPDDDWEQDFDVDITEEDLKKAQEAVKNITSKSSLKDLYRTTDEPEHEEEDWESWD